MDIIADSSFSYLRPIYVFLFFVLVIVLITVAFQKSHKIISGFAVIIISILCSVVSIMLTYQSGIIVDELSLSGDPVSLMMFIAVALMSFINVFVFFIRKSPDR